MELKESSGANPESSLLGEIFAVTRDGAGIMAKESGLMPSLALNAPTAAPSATDADLPNPFFLETFLHAFGEWCAGGDDSNAPQTIIGGGACGEARLPIQIQ